MNLCLKLIEVVLAYTGRATTNEGVNLVCLLCAVQYSLIVMLVIASELATGILLIMSKADVSSLLQLTELFIDVRFAA